MTGQQHLKYVKVPDQVLRTIDLWLDAESPLYGVYEGEDVRAKQKRGEAVPPPSLQ